MKTMLKTLSVAFVAASLAVGAYAQSYSFKRTPKVGEKYTFKLKGEFDMQGTTIVFTANVIDKVVKVEGDTVTTESSQTGGKINFNGMDMELPEGPPTKTTSLLSGQVQKIEGEEATPESYRMSHLQGFFPPSAPVKEGESWTVSVKGDSKIGTVDLEAKYKVIGTEKVGSWDAIKIEYTLTEKGGGDAASSSGTTWVDAKDFSLVKAVGVWKNAPIPGAPAPMSGKFTMERQAS